MADRRAEDWIDLVLRKSNELRAAGIVAIGVDGFSASLLPVDPAPEDAPDAGEDESSELDENARRDWRFDPRTYGGREPPPFDWEPISDEEQ